MEMLDLIAIGEIVKSQGIKGQLKVVPLTDDPNRFGTLRRVYKKGIGGMQELIIENYQVFNQYVLLKLRGIDNLAAADSLGRGLIYIPRNERLKLPPDRFYHDQILDLKVYTEDGKYLGIINQILETGSNDVYCVQGSSRQVLIPGLKSVVKEVDPEQGRMVVQLPPGLLEDEK